MEISKPNFYIQWHITNKCSQRCRQCYLFQKKEDITKQNDLESNKLCLIIDDMIETVNLLKANAVFVLTGGDPMMYSSFWQLLEKIVAKIKESGTKGAIDLLGNPFYVNQFTAEKLRSYGVRKFQLSLDGLEEKHDFLRKKGSFKETMRAAKDLKKAGIKTTCMFTLSRFNASDLISVMRKVAEEKFDAFAFARLCKPESWSVEQYKEQMFSPLEYKQLLISVHEEHKKIAKKYPEIRFVLKDHLWELFLYEKYTPQERKEVRKISRRKIVVGGCSLGIGSLSILADGSVYACRRFSSFIGKVPDQKLIDLFIDSEKLNFYRDFSQYEKCSSCPLLYICRGCGAVAYGYSGSFFDADPQCWYGLD